MSSPSISDLLDIREELRKTILFKLKLSEKDVQIGVQKIIDWFDDQPFMKMAQLDRKHVENMFIHQKGCFEATKHSLMNYYFMKIALPEFFKCRDPQAKELSESLKAISFCFQYPVSNSDERYLLIEFKEQTEHLDYAAYYKLFFIEMDMKIHSDFIGETVIIIDGRKIKQEHIEQFDRSMLFKSSYASQQAFGSKVKALHVVCAPESAKEFLNLIHTCFEKSSQFAVHKDMDSLHHSVQKELLPKSLGGNQDNVDEVQARWLKRAIDRRDWFLEEDEKYVDL